MKTSAEARRDLSLDATLGLGFHTIVERKSPGAAVFVKSPLDALVPLQEQLELHLWLVPDGRLVTGADGARIPCGTTIPVVVRRPGPAIGVSERQVWIAPLHVRFAEEEAAQSLQGANARLIAWVKQLAYLETLQPFYDGTPGGPKCARRIDATRAGIMLAQADIATQFGLDPDNMIQGNLLYPLALAYDRLAAQNPFEPTRAVLRFALSQVKAEVAQDMRSVRRPQNARGDTPPQRSHTGVPLFFTPPSVANYAPVTAEVTASMRTTPRGRRTFADLFAAGLVIPMAGSIMEQAARPVVVTPVPANAIPLDHRGIPQPGWKSLYIPNEARSTPHLASPVPQNTQGVPEAPPRSVDRDALAYQLYDALRAAGMSEKQIKAAFARLRPYADGSQESADRVLALMNELHDRYGKKDQGIVDLVKALVPDGSEANWTLVAGAFLVMGAVGVASFRRFSIVGRNVTLLASLLGGAVAACTLFAESQTSPELPTVVYSSQDGFEKAVLQDFPLGRLHDLSVDARQAPNVITLFERLISVLASQGVDVDKTNVPAGYVNLKTGDGFSLQTAFYEAGENAGYKLYQIAHIDATSGEAKTEVALWNPTTTTLELANIDEVTGNIISTGVALFSFTSVSDGTEIRVVNPSDPSRMLFLKTSDQLGAVTSFLQFVGVLPKAAYAESGIAVATGTATPRPTEETLFTATSPSPPTLTPTPTPTPTATSKPTATNVPPTEKPTAVQQPPTPVPTTEVLPTATSVAPPPAEVIPQRSNVWVKEGTQWMCRDCTWNTGYLYNNPNLKQLVLEAWNGSTRIYQKGGLTVDEFNNEVQRLKNEGYSPYNMLVGQAEAYGNPTAGQIAPQNLWYTMTK